MEDFSMNENLMKLTEKFDSFSLRNRLVFTFVGVLVLALLVDFLWIADNYKATQQLQQDIQQTEKTIAELINSQNQLNSNVIKNRNSPQTKKLVRVEKQLEQIKKTLDKKTINLVEPELMAGVLREIIRSSKKLKLISLTKQQPVALFNQQENTKSVQVYKHLVELLLEGGYDDTKEFLSLMEKMPQKVNFESLQYEVEKYPTSRIKLVVSTLSFDRKWIGG